MFSRFCLEQIASSGHFGRSLPSIVGCNGGRVCSNVLEPVKPVGLYLIASGNVIDGTVLIGLGEIAKITIVERIFHAGRDKLMTIPAFAWSYERVMSLRAYLETLAVWQAMSKAVRAIKQKVRQILALAKNSLTRRAD